MLFLLFMAWRAVLGLGGCWVGVCGVGGGRPGHEKQKKQKKHLLYNENGVSGSKKAEKAFTL